MHLKRILIAALLLSFVVRSTSVALARNASSGTQTGGQAAPSPGSQPEYALLTADELDSLVAPIALYPDALVAQVLGASTFPYEVVAATLWIKDNSSLTGEALAKAVDQQSWDPAVKALTQFPSVLDDLSKNLAWTSALGEASATQQQDVMAAVQRMRAKALAAGNLQSGPPDKGRAAGSTDHRYPACESSGRLRSGIQPHGRIWRANCCSRLLLPRSRGYRDFLRRRNRRRSIDLRRLLRVGMELLGHELA